MFIRVLILSWANVSIMSTTNGEVILSLCLRLSILPRREIIVGADLTVFGKVE